MKYIDLLKKMTIIDETVIDLSHTPIVDKYKKEYYKILDYFRPGFTLAHIPYSILFSYEWNLYFHRNQHTLCVVVSILRSTTHAYEGFI